VDADRIKWNQRFSSADTFLGEAPSPFLQREIDRIKALAPGTRALDIACGEGRNSIFLGQHGFKVTALDISDMGLTKAKKRASERGLSIDFRQVDLEGCILTGNYDLVLNFNFLLRELIPQEVAVLNPDGLLLFDSILESPAMLAAHNPDYLLRHGELARLFSDCAGDILLAEENPDCETPTARLMFRKAPDKAVTPPQPVTEGIT
jgi:2-polyprenyl-3-methyl-5-hydroxy-6-metoxy-1,4-benzoquinol methylase